MKLFRIRIPNDSALKIFGKYSYLFEKHNENKIGTECVAYMM